MSITLTIKVTVESFKLDASAKGYFMARGIRGELVSVDGAKAEQIEVFNFNHGNGTIGFATKSFPLVKTLQEAKLKAKAAAPAPAPADLQKALASMAPEDLQNLLQGLLTAKAPAKTSRKR
jgi:hypothetical protein